MLSKVLVYCCFLVFRRVACEYGISLDRFCFVNLTSSCFTRSSKFSKSCRLPAGGWVTKWFVKIGDADRDQAACPFTRPSPAFSADLNATGRGTATEGASQCGNAESSRV